MKLPDYFVYALTDPNSGLVRYVGATRNNLSARLNRHCGGVVPRCKRKQNPSAKDKWINGLLLSGKRPIISVLEVCTIDTVAESEKRWISHFLNRGPLTNGKRGSKYNERNFDLFYQSQEWRDLESMFPDNPKIEQRMEGAKP